MTTTAAIRNAAIGADAHAGCFHHAAGFVCALARMRVLSPTGTGTSRSFWRMVSSKLSTALLAQQAVPQLGFAAGDARLDGAERHVQHFGDFLVRKFVEVKQRDGCPVKFRQLR